MTFDMKVTSDNVLTLMFYPFLEQMKNEINEAESRGTQRFLAGYVLEVYRYCKERGAISKKHEEELESYDIPYFEMFTGNLDVYKVQ